MTEDLIAIFAQNISYGKEWNKADVYARTIAYFATRLAGGE
jgi:membrane-bound lytic murein transglycosylase B